MSQGPLKVVCKITLLRGPGLNTHPIYHLAVVLTSQSEFCTVTKDSPGCAFGLEYINAITVWVRVFCSVPVMLRLPLASRATPLIIALHNQIALWESDDFVSGGDNAEYDDQLNHA